MTAPLAPAREQHVRTLLQQGLSVREISRQTGVSYSAVYRRAVQMGRTMTRGHANKPDHPWSGKETPKKALSP
jgi:DNA invertase Pin-like site-specific DNA recombinase